MDLEPHVALLWCPIKHVAFLNLQRNVDPGERHLLLGPSVGCESSGMADSAAAEFGFNRTSSENGVKVAFGEV